MKSLIFAACIAGLSPAVVAQDVPQEQVPSLILNAFQSKFSNATDIEWEKKGEFFKVEFEIGSIDHDLWIDKTGNFKKHKQESSKADLPEAVNQKIKTEFSGYRVDEVDKIETDGKVFYEVELDSKSDDRDVLFAADGNIQ
jgi:uncharacterized membrane protein YkoI